MKLAKLALNLYNQCPNACVQKELTRNLYTQLVKEPPSKIQFKFMNSKGKTFNDDVFLHLAYERSIDKNWIAAAWSDPTGIVTYSKCWYCSHTEGDSKNGATDLGSVIDDIWGISCDLFKRVNDELNKTNALGGKKYLVLTRINSVIPEMELYHWKRLSVKHKDISLIVLSVNRAPKLVFTNESSGNNHGVSSEAVPTTEGGYATSSPGKPPPQSQNDKEAYLKNFAESNNPSPNGFGATSPLNVMNFHSPQNFLSATGNFLSPQDIGSVPSSTSNLVNPGGDADMILHDISSDIYGIVPKLPLPSFFSNNRSGYKLGYLLKEFTYKEQTGHLVFEVCILSCSNFWNSNTLLTLLLNHYKKLILLNDILGLRHVEGNNDLSDQNTNNDQTTTDFEVEGIIPWHIAAVGKALDYLVHIYVED
jgi:mediator of RNA polymerase II transcription subunit 13